MPQMHPMTKIVLGLLISVILLLAPAFTTFTYNSLADDIQENKERVAKVEEAVHEIQKQGAVQEALQSEQNDLLRQVLSELKNGSARPGS